MCSAREVGSVRASAAIFDWQQQQQPFCVMSGHGKHCCQACLPGACCSAEPDNFASENDRLVFMRAEQVYNAILHDLRGCVVPQSIVIRAGCCAIGTIYNRYPSLFCDVKSDNVLCTADFVS